MTKGMGQPPTHQFYSQAFPFRRNLQQRVNEIETSTGEMRDCIVISPSPVQGPGDLLTLLVSLKLQLHNGNRFALSKESFLK